MLIQTVCSAAFIVPGAYGVQEVGLMQFGVLFGLSPEIGLTLSFIKRIREMILGIPAVIAWQWLEGRKLLRRRSGSEPSEP